MNDAITLLDPDATGVPTQAADPGAPASGAWSDRLGVIASVGCAIHCAAMPFVISYLPSLGLSFLADEAFHKWMAVGCFMVALAAFIPGLRQHGRWTPVTIATAGLAMISIAAFGFAGECCPSCSTDDSTLASTGAADCADAGCTLCPSEAPAASATRSPGPPAGPEEGPPVGLAEASPAASPWVSEIAPWLTPVGGLVLVSAHLLNQRYGCLCGCCGIEPDDGAKA